MNVTLADFIIADGMSRIHQTVGEETLSLEQQTQTATPLRGAWKVGFPDRAARSIQRSYVVTFPPCDSLDLAFLQSAQIPITCPKGGVLIEQQGAQQITYPAAWIHAPITCKRIGVTNQFTFHLEAVNPSATALSTLAQMSMNAVANLYAITGLTGGGSTKLDGYATADVAVGFVAFITPVIAAIAQPKMMRLITDPDPGVTVTNTDPSAGALIVLPLDYDEDNNPKIWIEQ